MIKKVQLFTLLLAVGAVALGLAVAGCGGGSSSSSAGSTTTAKAEVTNVPFVNSPENGIPTTVPDPKHESLTIGLLDPLRSTEVVSTIFNAAEEEVSELGGKSIELDAKLNPDKQVSDFEQLLNDEVDAIAIVPIAEPKLLAPVLKEAAEKGIPVVGMDALPGVPAPLPGFATDIWQQRDKMVYLEVKAATEALGKGAKVGQIGLAAPVPLFNFAEERTAYWAKKFGLDIVEKVESKSDNVEGGQKAAEGLLAKNPEIVGIIGYNDEPAIGAASAARAAGRSNIETFGACCGLALGRGAIESGRLTATVVFDAATYGRTAVRAAFDAAQGVKLPPQVLAGKLEILTAENLH
jgi:ribose transport system substrate-binding protein